MKNRSIIVAAVAMLFLVGIIVLAQATTPKQLPPTQEAESKFLETVRLVKAANLAGATNNELTGSVAKLNEALSLIESVNQLEQQGQLSEANNVAREALQILSSVQSEALALQERAQARSEQQKLLTYMLAPIMALVTVLVYHYGRKANRRYRIAKTMSMRVRVKPNVKRE